jgi:hypothetical protein
MKRFLQIVLLLTCASGCLAGIAAPSAIAPTPTSQPSTSPPEVKPSLLSPTPARPTPTSSPIPATPTPPPLTPTPTPLIPLRTDGPYLTYFKEVDEGQQFAFLDADGVGRKLLTLPPGESASTKLVFAKSDQWLVLVANRPPEAKRSKFSVGWYLVHLPDGETHFLDISSDPGIFFLRPIFSPDEKWVTLAGYHETRSIDSASTAEVGWFLVNLLDQGIFFVAEFNEYGPYRPSFSPDSQKLAFLAPPPFSSLTPAPTNSHPGLLLNVVQASDHQLIKQWDLFPADYPQNFEKVVEQIQGISPSDLQESFERGLYAFAWSPEGRYLAFAAGIDGPSSDLYVYDWQTQKLRRLDDDLENIQSLWWSNDGKKIEYYSSFYPGCEGECFSHHIATLDGQPAQTLPQPDSHGGINHYVGELNASTEVVYSQANVTGSAFLSLFDTVTGRSTALYPYTLDAVAMDPTSKMLLVVSLHATVEGTPQGVHLINPGTGVRQAVSPEACECSADQYCRSNASSLKVNEYRFLVQCPQRTALVALDGTTQKISDQNVSLAWAPHQTWLVEFNQSKNEISLLSADLQVVRTFAVQAYTDMTWRSDGLGIFYLAEDKLYYLAFDSSGPQEVDRGVVEIEDWVAK